MFDESKRLFGDAERLAQAAPADHTSNSSHLLSLLGFEVLLKLAFELTNRRRAPQSHNYRALLSGIPLPTREEIEERARIRVGPAAFEVPLDAILDDWATNFVALRYPYERYSDMSEDEYKRRGPDWVARGAKLEEAEFRFHPEALFGMVESLKAVVESHG
jgi:hypothetical protein